MSSGPLVWPGVQIDAGVERAARLIALGALDVAEAVGVEHEVEPQALLVGEGEERGVGDDGAAGADGVDLHAHRVAAVRLARVRARR